MLIIKHGESEKEKGENRRGAGRYEIARWTILGRSQTAGAAKVKSERQ
jgi:hypothetical protein